jgi:formylglycine-generating enzyme required for sulfatase activity
LQNKNGGKQMKNIFLCYIFALAPFVCFAQETANMILVEGGSFTMGSPSSELNRGGNEGPQHDVSVSNFYLGIYEVTQKEWSTVMETNPSYNKGDNLPVENITWYEAVQYCNARSVKENLIPAYSINKNVVDWNSAANGYRLPTEAEWEYAAKGGNKDKVTFLYAGSNTADTVGWHSGNSKESQRGGRKAPNSLGFYDLSGNVGEMCWDMHGTYNTAPQIDPHGASSGGYHVGRGGCWYYDVQYLRTSFRAYIDPSTRYLMVGFRLARNVDQKELK